MRRQNGWTLAERNDYKGQRKRVLARFTIAKRALWREMVRHTPKAIGDAIRASRVLTHTREQGQI